MHTVLTASEAVALATGEMAQLVERLSQHQRALGESDVGFCLRHQALGSPRSWSRLRAHDWAACPIGRWLVPLRRLVAEIEHEALPDPGVAGVAPLLSCAERWLAAGEFRAAGALLELAERRLHLLREGRAA